MILDNIIIKFKEKIIMNKTTNNIKTYSDESKECALRCFQHYRRGMITYAELEVSLKQIEDDLEYDTVFEWYISTKNE